MKQRLTTDLEAAHAEVMKLGAQEVKNLLRDDWDGSAALERKLALARHRRDEAIRAFRAHIAEHGC